MVTSAQSRRQALREEFWTWQLRQRPPTQHWDATHGPCWSLLGLVLSQQESEEVKQSNVTQFLLLRTPFKSYERLWFPYHIYQSFEVQITVWMSEIWTRICSASYRRKQAWQALRKKAGLGLGCDYATLVWETNIESTSSIFLWQETLHCIWHEVHHSVDHGYLVLPSW